MRFSQVVVVTVWVVGCGARTDLVVAADGSTAPDVEAPLGVSADFYVSVSTDSARAGANANGLFWTGENRPRPGGGGGRSFRLSPGESVSVNGVALVGGQADWGYTYQGGGLPVPSDGRWVFRFVMQGRSFTRTLSLRPISWVDFPTAPVSIARGVTLRWSPALPDETERRAYLTSCVANEQTSVGTSSARFMGRLTADPCLSHAQVYATLTAPIGPPFRSGTLSASTTLDRELRVTP